MKRAPKKKSTSHQQLFSILGVTLGLAGLLITTALVLQIQNIGTTSRADDGQQSAFGSSFFGGNRDGDGDSETQGNRNCPAKSITRGATRADGALHECSITCGSKPTFVRTRGTGYTPAQCDQLAQTLCGCSRDPGKCDVEVINKQYCLKGSDHDTLQFKCTYENSPFKDDPRLQKMYKRRVPVGMCDSLSNPTDIEHARQAAKQSCCEKTEIDDSSCVSFEQSEVWESLAWVQIIMEGVRQQKEVSCDWSHNPVKCCLQDKP